MTSSYDAGELIRVTRDAHGTLLVHHGAKPIATIKPALGGRYRVEADGRTWRLTTDDDGWSAEGDPPAAFIKGGLFASDRLVVGNAGYKLGRLKVKGLLHFKKATHSGKPALAAEIEKAPNHEDPHALVALATAAVVLGVSLRPPDAHIPAQQTPTAGAFSHGPG